MAALESKVYILPATGKHLHMDRIERTDNSDVPISGTPRPTPTPTSDELNKDHRVVHV
jgi:hypothetical protein